MRQFGIFAKYWQPGTVKTRLAARVGDGLAADFHLACLQLLLKRLHRVADRQLLDVWPPESCAKFEQLDEARHFVVGAQTVGDLGAKMAAYFATAHNAGAQQTILIGSDSAWLTPADISHAFEALESRRVVLGPSDDGGYYLVGCAGPAPPMFDDIAWSTPNVWPQTIARLVHDGINWVALPRGFDTDELSDVSRLSDVLSEQAKDAALPEMKRLLEVTRKCLDRT